MTAVLPYKVIWNVRQQWRKRPSISAKTTPAPGLSLSPNNAIFLFLIGFYVSFAAYGKENEAFIFVMSSNNNNKKKQSCKNVVLLGAWRSVRLVGFLVRLPQHRAFTMAVAMPASFGLDCSRVLLWLIVDYQERAFLFAGHEHVTRL